MGNYSWFSCKICIWNFIEHLIFLCTYFLNIFPFLLLYPLSQGQATNETLKSWSSWHWLKWPTQQEELAGRRKGWSRSHGWTAPVPERRWQWLESGQLRELGSAMAKTVGVKDLGSSVAKTANLHRCDEASWGSPALLPPWGKNPLNGIHLGTNLLWVREWGDTGKVLSLLFYVFILGFWDLQGFYCFLIVTQSFVRAAFVGL